VSLLKTKAALLRVARDGAAPLPAAPSPGAALDIVVDDTVARHWIVERPAGLADAAELDAFAAARFTALFGADPAAWVVRVDPVARARCWLACALPAVLVTELSQTAAAQGWRVRRLQSRFVREYNRHCRRLGPTAAFCVASRSGTTLGLLAAGEWRSIRVHPPLSRSAADFAQLLQRDCRRVGVDADGLPTFTVGSQRDRVRREP